MRDCVPYSLLYIPGFPPGHCTYKCCRKETYSSVYGHVSIPVIQVVDTTPYIREQGNFARTINPTGDFCSTTDRV